MQLIAIITEEQKDKLVGQTIQPGWFFNPVKDGNDNWIISKEEIDASINHQWIKDLSLTEFVAPIEDGLGIL